MSTIHRAHGHASRRGSFEHAGHYDRFFGRLARGLYARVAADVAAAGLPDGGRVLDAGTGPGRVPLAIAAAAASLRIDGLDQSPQMIEHARQAASAAGVDDRVSFAVGDVADMPYPDDAYEFIVSTISQHHWADVAGAIRELRRVLCPGGRLWIYDFRFALGRAEIAARTAFPGYTVRREPVRTGRFPLRLIGRLAIEQG